MKNWFKIVFEADIYKNLLNQSQKLHDTAREKYSTGQRVKIGKDYYIFTFEDGVFVVTKENDPEFNKYPIRYNTRKLPEAKKWLIEYLQN